LNPDGVLLLMTVTTDTHEIALPPRIRIGLPSGVINPQFIITGDKPWVANLDVPGEPVFPPPGSELPIIREVFVFDQNYNVLQLTNFRRGDTWPALVDVDRKHIYFPASANPLGTNPSENCQLFSIDRLGRNLRQLTSFREREHSQSGCFFGGRVGNGCALIYPVQDPRSRTLLFYSTCDPLGENPNGVQIFAIQPDGTGLRQVTDARGMGRDADGTYSAQLPALWAYGPYEP
jgi:hypothetical protein